MLNGYCDDDVVFVEIDKISKELLLLPKPLKLAESDFVDAFDSLKSDGLSFECVSAIVIVLGKVSFGSLFWKSSISNTSDELLLPCDGNLLDSWTLGEYPVGELTLGDGDNSLALLLSADSVTASISIPDGRTVDPSILFCSKSNFICWLAKSSTLLILTSRKSDSNWPCGCSIALLLCCGDEFMSAATRDQMVGFKMYWNVDRISTTNKSFMK